jgi:hypothetical protein
MQIALVVQTGHHIVVELKPTASQSNHEDYCTIWRQKRGGQFLC